MMRRLILRIIMLVLVFALLPSFAHAGIGVGQVCSNLNTGSTTSIACTITATTTGSAIVVGWREASDQTSTVSCTDSSAQSYTQSASGYTTTTSLNFRGGLFYKANSASITSVTCTSVPGSVTGAGLAVFEITGAVSASPEDASVNSNTGGSGATSLTSGTLTTTNANDILLYMVAANADTGGFTSGSGYTIPTNGQTTNRLMIQYLVVSTIQTNTTTSASWVNVTNPASVFIAIKAAAVANSATLPSPFVITL